MVQKRYQVIKTGAEKRLAASVTERSENYLRFRLNQTLLFFSCGLIAHTVNKSVIWYTTEPRARQICTRVSLMPLVEQV